jgi:hypothetical protein
MRLYWVAVVKVPTKKGDYEGEEAELVTEVPVLVMAEDKQQASIKGVTKAGVVLDTNRMKVFVCPFEEEA